MYCNYRDKYQDHKSCPLQRDVLAASESPLSVVLVHTIKLALHVNISKLHTVPTYVHIFA